MTETPKTVALMRSNQEFDLAKLNAAMDAIVAADFDEAAGRYALMHTYGWPATEAVEYARAAQHCFDNTIDPNEL